MKASREPFEGIWALPSFPVVLVTVGRNIMTAAAFHFYSFEPPCVMVGIRPDNLTYELIAEKQEYGINLPTTGQLEVVRLCGSVSGRDADKFERAGLTPKKGTKIDSYLIAECPVSIECRVVHEINFPGTHRWFVGQIEAAHIEAGYSREWTLMYWPREYRAVGELLLSAE
jgi:flavin reductase (DIM6/NTAB) family NADH-FMN oxidoreductase RutF